MKLITLISCLIIFPFGTAIAENYAVLQLLNSYQAETKKQPNAEKGQQLWNQTFTGKSPFTERSCRTCHTSNLKLPGQHIRTKKTIEPLAPSVNEKSLSEVKKIKKWLKRNCKWSIGRECTAGEKANLLTFLNQQ